MGLLPVDRTNTEWLCRKAMRTSKSFIKENSRVQCRQKSGPWKSRRNISYLDVTTITVPRCWRKDSFSAEKKNLDVLFFTYEVFLKIRLPQSGAEEQSGVNQPMRKREYPKEPICGREMLLLFKTQLRYSECVSADGEPGVSAEESFFFEPGLLRIFRIHLKGRCGRNEWWHWMKVLLKTELGIILTELYRPTTVHRCKSAFQSLILDLQNWFGIWDSMIFRNVNRR